MRHRILLLIPLTFLCLATISFRYLDVSNDNDLEKREWGFFAHKRINRLAVFTLPPELFTFYKKHIEFITEHAVDPDKRRYASEVEAPRHYIDIDHYAHGDEDPFEVVPKKWNDAVDKFTEDTLQSYGIVPWHVNLMVYKLTNAFKDKNLDRILQLSADLGHYIGDAHVPLHTTENYNGQLTGQKGIHGFWESRIPELEVEDYDFLVGRATYVEHTLDHIWKAVEVSHHAVDSVLTFERILSAKYPADKKYSFEQRGAQTVKVYSIEYSTDYSNMMDGMVERRMKNAIICIGSFWYTAWVNAGQPDLSDLTNKEISTELEEELEKQNKEYQKGKIFGREHQH